MASNSRTRRPKNGLPGRWLRGMIGRPVDPAKPRGLHLPDRVWRRHSAVIATLYGKAP